MWLSSRRKFLQALCVPVLLAACEFTPVYAPNNAGSKLLDRIATPEPTTHETYLMNRRIEGRLGRATDGPLALSFSVVHSFNGLGTTATGITTRYQRTGTATYSLTNSETGAVITSGAVTNFTGYSASGNTAATLAAERDSIERLMIILADMIIDKLYAIDPNALP